MDDPDRQPSPSPARSSSPAAQASSRGATPSSPLRPQEPIPATLKFLEGIEQAADSPSDAYAAMTLSSNSDSAADGPEQDAITNDSIRGLEEKGLTRRSASPAKRTASAMEASDDVSAASQQDTGADTIMAGANEGSQDLALLDERVETVLSLQGTTISDNEAGYLVSYRWLGRIFVRSTKMRSIRVWDQDALGPIGPIDNSDIVTTEALVGPHLKFEGTEAPFVPIIPQLERGTHFEVLPKAAWDLVVEWYGLSDNQIPIIRYARNTAPPGSAQPNIVYEYYPPVFTVRKMISGRKLPSPASSQTNTRSGSPDGESLAIKLVASRQDRFNSFLARSKKAAGIPLDHKVRPWRLVASQTNQPVAIPTPAASRSTSPGAQSTSVRLVVEKAEFDAMEDASSIEIIEAQDNTANSKYNGSMNLDILGLTEDMTLIFEEQIRGPAGGEFSSDARRAKKKNEETPQVSTGPLTRGRTRRDGRPRGTIGLTNLGNTCYMNSALQCISRIEELAYYFLVDRHKQEINVDNPLGYNGRMAKSYADFLHNLYLPGASSAYTPRAFKNALSQAQPMFSGYGQQDSQEFLSFLVDALHEDLNRIHKKPYLENPDSDDNKVHDPEYIKELGAIYRDNHKKRNDSIAMDLFNGFYKNTMVCPSCDKISVTFDPYSLLTLQLPVENTWQHKIFFLPRNGSPSRHTVDLDKNASIRTFKQHFASKIGGLDPLNLFVAEAFDGRLYKVFRDGETVSEITAQDIIMVFEFSEPPTNISKAPAKSYGYQSIITPVPEDAVDMDSPLAERMAVTVINRTQKDVSWRPQYKPMVIMVTREEAKNYDAILKKILAGLRNYTSRKFLDENPIRSRRSSESLTSSDEKIDGKLSDRSLPSEDEYVNVSMKDVADSAFRPDVPVSEALQSLFEVKVCKGNPGDFQVTSSQIGNNAIPMLHRVKALSRRSSVASLNSVASKSTTSSVHSQATTTTESSEGPAVNVRRFSPADGVVSDEDEETVLMEPSPVEGFNRGGRRKPMNPRRRRNQVTYGRRQKKRQPRSDAPQPASQNAEGDPYYLKLGEGIFLDWTEDGWDALFGGDPRTPDDLRGYKTIEDNMDVIKDEALEEKIQKRMRRKKEGVTLEDCFAETAKTETLSEENAWYCNRCKELRRADKTLMIWTAPDILVVHLKRFSGERYRRDKVDVLVDFPLEGLDLTKWIGCKEEGKEYLYDLQGCVNHFGGLGGGHYTAYARNPFNSNKWHEFNGECIKILVGNTTDGIRFLRIGAKCQRGRNARRLPFVLPASFDNSIRTAVPAGPGHKGQIRIRGLGGRPARRPVSAAAWVVERLSRFSRSSSRADGGDRRASTSPRRSTSWWSWYAESDDDQQ